MFTKWKLYLTLILSLYCKNSKSNGWYDWKKLDFKCCFNSMKYLRLNKQYSIRRWYHTRNTFSVSHNKVRAANYEVYKRRMCCICSTISDSKNRHWWSSWYTERRSLLLTNYAITNRKQPKANLYEEWIVLNSLFEIEIKFSEPNWWNANAKLNSDRGVGAILLLNDYHPS